MSVNISYETGEELGVEGYEQVIEDVVNKALDMEGCPYEAEVNITLADEDAIREINSEFRDIDLPTDVLSFPAIDYEVPGDFEGLEEMFEKYAGEYFNPDTGELMLGDMMISVPRIKNQAEEYGHSIKRELAFLVAHSMFHLMGYDHMEEDEAGIMESKQEAALQKLGITRD